MWASAVACAWKAISPFRPGKVACAGGTPVTMQAKMAPATVSGIRVLGFTVSSCDVQIWLDLSSWGTLQATQPQNLAGQCLLRGAAASITMCRGTAFWNCRSGLPFTRQTVDRPQFRSPSEILDTCEAHLFESAFGLAAPTVPI